METETQELFEKAGSRAEACYEQIRSYEKVGYNPHEIDFTAEVAIFNAIRENITRLKIRNKHNDSKLREIALAFSDYIDALSVIMEARIYLSVDMKEDAWETMARKIYEPRLTIQEITRSVQEMLGSDYVNPVTRIPNESKTISAISLYSLDVDEE